MKNQFDVRFNFLNTIYKAWLTLRKFNFELKLRNPEKKSLMLETGVKLS